jgi:AcrR family transcriptional regulator
MLSRHQIDTELYREDVQQCIQVHGQEKIMSKVIPLSSSELSKSRRERERLELRTKIFDAARELFASQGYEAVTLRKIAETINYSPTTIYSYFKDKESLISEIVAHDFKEYTQAFSSCASIEDPWQRLKCAGRIYMSWGIAHPYHYRMMFMSPPAVSEANKKTVEPLSDPSIHEAYAFLQSTVREAIAKGYFHPDFSDEELLVQMLWAGMHGIVTLAIAQGRDARISWKSPEEISETMMNVFMRGLKRD